MFKSGKGKKQRNHGMNLMILLLISLVVISFPKSILGASDGSVGLLSRIDFAPALLEMISHELERTTGRHFSLIFQPVEASGSINFSDSLPLMLVEKGIPEIMIPEGLEKTDLSISLVWVLAAGKDVTQVLGSQTLTLDKFAALLAELRQNDPQRFPWFEPLLSKNTMRNFCLLYGEKSQKTSTRRHRAAMFHQQPHAAAMLYRAIESELLNPLSVEADLGLAMEVFAAGDADFVSYWLPQSYLNNAALRPAELAGVSFMPFPLSGNRTLLPKLTLNLWKSKEQKIVSSISADAQVEINDSVVELDFLSETAWINSLYPANYDALIVGDL